MRREKPLTNNDRLVIALVLVLVVVGLIMESKLF